MSERASPPGHGRALDPVLIMLLAMIVAVALTWLVPSGAYQRAKADGAKGEARDGPALVVAGTYRPLPKPLTPAALNPAYRPAPGMAAPASPLALATAIPAGLVKSAGLVSMIMLLGGMFGVLRATGALDAGIERLIALSNGRPALLVPVLMLAISAGSTFLGLISEYLLLVPVMLGVAGRLGRPALFGFALLTLAAKVGYLASVTNPVGLLVAQKVAGVAPFSGMGLRLGIWLGFLALAMGWVLRTGATSHAPPPPASARLSPRHAMVLAVAALVVALLVHGSLARGWGDGEFAALFLCGAAGMAGAARMPASEAVTQFVGGMKGMVLAALLVGMGRGTELILRDAQVLDTLVYAMSQHVSGLPPALVAPILMLFEMGLTLLIPSTSAKAALSIPILAPIAAQAGVSGQTTVLAFLMGNGLVNMIAPTSGMLLAYLAAADIPYGQWFRYVAPLFALFAGLAVVILALAAAGGY